MVEIDHSTLPQPEPEPAIPMLASTLLELEEKQRTRFTRRGLPERLGSGCEEVDEILGGGIERGIMMGISAEGIEGRLVSLQGKFGMKVGSGVKHFAEIIPHLILRTSPLVQLVFVLYSVIFIPPQRYSY